MRRKKILILPKLKDRQKDLSKKWYVELSQRNPQNGEMLRKRFEVFENININNLGDLDSRYQLAKKLIDSLNERLNSGWTIFADVSECVYEDQLQYASSAKVYKKTIDSNNNYSFWTAAYIKEELEQKDSSFETLRTYKSRLRVVENWLKGKKLITYDLYSINNPVIVEFFNYLKKERKLCARTYNSYKQLLFDLFQFALKKGGIEKNPVFDIPQNKFERDLGAERIDKEDLIRLMKTMDEIDPQIGLACRFEYYCGMRPGYEIRLLKIGDIDFRKGWSKVKIIQENAKTNRIRKVTIPDSFLDYLINIWHLDVFDKGLYVIGRHGMPGKEPLGRNTLRNRFNQIRDKLKLPKYYKFYSLKHTGAVILAEQGETIINIRDHLGHTSIVTTEVYLKRHGFNESKIIRHNFPEI